MFFRKREQNWHYKVDVWCVNREALIIFAAAAFFGVKKSFLGDRSRQSAQ